MPRSYVRGTRVLRAAYPRTDPAASYFVGASFNNRPAGPLAATVRT
jgi:hypothetical protein